MLLTLVAAGHISLVPACSQSLAADRCKTREAAVWATIPGSGSRKTRMVMACRRRRDVICSVMGVLLAISPNETQPPGGIMSAIRNSAMACRQAELLCFHVVMVNYRSCHILGMGGACSLPHACV